MYERMSSDSSPGCETMPFEAHTASPVGRCRHQSASPPSAATGDDDTLHPTVHPVLQMLRRIAHTASYIPGSACLRASFFSPKSEPVSLKSCSLRRSCSLRLGRSWTSFLRGTELISPLPS